MDFYIDIETVRQWKDYHEAPARLQELFAKRFFSDYYQAQNPGVTIENRWNDQAGLTAEFGMIICISVTWFKPDATLGTAVWKGAEHKHDGSGSLQMFKQMLDKNPSCRLIAHNGKQFDFPILARRMMIWGIPVGNPLNAYGKKPWEMRGLVDTVEMWAHTEHKSFVSLDTLCELFGVPTPKDGPVTGATVGEFYWNDPVGSLPIIGQYCGKDTVALARVHKKLEAMLVPPKGE